MTGDLRASTAEYDEAVEGYNQSILDAFAAVASQIARLQALETEAKEANKALQLARKAYALATRGYQSGLTDYLNVLTVENTLLDMEDRNVSIAAQRLAVHAGLMRDLGGGYEAGRADGSAGGMRNPLDAPAVPEGLPESSPVGESAYGSGSAGQRP